jgi:hypothetical protein
MESGSSGKAGSSDGAALTGLEALCGAQQAGSSLSLHQLCFSPAKLARPAAPSPGVSLDVLDVVLEGDEVGEMAMRGGSWRRVNVGREGASSPHAPLYRAPLGAAALRVSQAPAHCCCPTTPPACRPPPGCHSGRAGHPQPRRRGRGRRHARAAGGRGRPHGARAAGAQLRWARVHCHGPHAWQERRGCGAVGMATTHRAPGCIHPT